MFCCRRRNKKTGYKTPTSPELTQDEINKIKDNINNITDFNNMMYSLQTTSILEVYDKLYSATKPANVPDSKKEHWSNILCSALEIVGILSDQPEIEVLAVVIGGVVEYITENSDEFKTEKVDLSKDFESELIRNDDTYDTMGTMIGNMYDDPNKYRDQVLSITGYKSCVLRDLIDIVIPNKNTTAFKNALIAHRRAFQQKITIEEMAKLENWELNESKFANFGNVSRRF
jgi:hypothetical protein